MPLNTDEWEITPLSKPDFNTDEWDITPIKTEAAMPNVAEPVTQATSPIPIPERKGDRSVSREFVSGLRRSIPELKGTLATFKGAIGAIIGSETMAMSGLEAAKKYELEAEAIAPKPVAPSIVKSYQEGKTIQDLPYWLSNLLGEQAIILGTSVVSGVTGAIVGSAAGPGGTLGGAVAGVAGRGIVKKYAERVMKDFIESGVKKGLTREAARDMAEKQSARVVGRIIGAKTAVAVNMGIIEGGGMYAESVEKGNVGALEAAKSLGLGMVAGSLEVIGGASRLIDTILTPKNLVDMQRSKNIFIEFGKRIAGASARVMPEEFLQEAGQEFLAVLNQRLSDSEVSLFDKQAMLRYLESGLSGAAVGGVFGVGGAAIDMTKRGVIPVDITQAKEKNKKTEEEQKLWDAAVNKADVQEQEPTDVPTVEATDTAEPIVEPIVPDVDPALSEAAATTEVEPRDLLVPTTEATPILPVEEPIAIVEPEEVPIIEPAPEVPEPVEEIKPTEPEKKLPASITTESLIAGKDLETMTASEVESDIKNAESKLLDVELDLADKTISSGAKNILDRNKETLESFIGNLKRLKETRRERLKGAELLAGKLAFEDVEDIPESRLDFEIDKTLNKIHLREATLSNQDLPAEYVKDIESNIKLLQVHLEKLREVKNLAKPPDRMLDQTAKDIEHMSLTDLKLHAKAIQGLLRGIEKTKDEGKHPKQVAWVEALQSRLQKTEEQINKLGEPTYTTAISKDVSTAVDTVMGVTSPEKTRNLVAKYGHDISTEDGRHSYLSQIVKKYKEYLNVLQDVQGLGKEDLLTPEGKVELLNIKPQVLQSILNKHGLTINQIYRINEKVNIIALHVFKTEGFLANLDSLQGTKLIRDLEENRRILPDEHPIRQLQRRAGIGYFEDIASLIRDYAEANEGNISVGEAEKIIRKFGEDNGIIIQEDEVDKTWRKTGGFNGAEHNVILDVGRQSVVKWIYHPVFGESSSMLNYLKRIELFNRVFPGATIRVIGLVDRGESNSIFGRYVLLLEQPFIHGTAPSIEQIYEWAWRRGWVGRGNNLLHPDLGIKLIDFHEGNAKITPAGKLIAYDVLVTEMDDSDFADIPKLREDAKKELKDIIDTRSVLGVRTPDFMRISDPTLIKPPASETPPPIGDVEEATRAHSEKRLFDKIKTGWRIVSYLNRLPIVASALSNKKFKAWIDKSVAELDQVANAGERLLRYFENAYQVGRDEKNFASVIRRNVLEGNVPEFTTVPQVEFVPPSVAEKLETPPPIPTPSQVAQEDGQAVIADKPAEEVRDDYADPEADVPTKGESLKLVKKKITTLNHAFLSLDGVDALSRHYNIPMRRAFNMHMAIATIIDMSKRIQQLFKDVKAGDLLKDKNNSNNAIKDKIMMADKIMDEYEAEPNEIIEPIVEKRGRKKKEKQIPDIVDALEKKGEEALLKILADVEQEAVTEVEEESVDARLDNLEKNLADLQSRLKQKDRQVQEAKKKGIKLDLDEEITLEPDTDKRTEMINEMMIDQAPSPIKEARELGKAKIFRKDPRLVVWKGFFQSIAGANARKATTSARDVLSFMANNLPKNSWAQTWARILLDQASDKLAALPVYFGNAEGERGSAYYYESNKIYINLANESVGSGVSGTVLHEVIHGLTTRALKDTEIRKQFEELLEQSKKALPQEAVELMEKFGTAKQLNRNIGHIAGYGYSRKAFQLAYSHSNVDEFLAGVLNQVHLREHLKSQVIGKAEQAKTLWQRVVRWFSENVFKTTDYTMLDKVLDKMGDELINRPQEDVDRIWASFHATEENIYENIRDNWQDIRAIMDTNTDLRGWQKFIPMHILGKRFRPAKAIMGAWMEGMRLLNRMLFAYEFDINPTTGKQTVKSFFELSHPLKPVTKVQKLFDKISVESDRERKELTHDEIVSINTQFNIGASAEDITKAEEAYREIRQSYRHAWTWYWDNVRHVGLRVYELRPWFAELQDVMMNRNTQIGIGLRNSIASRYGTIEVAKFVRARDSMIKAWNTIQDAQRHFVEGYMPRRRLQGRYRVNIKDHNGNLIDVQFALNELEAHRIKYRALQQAPGATVEAFYVSPSPENLFDEFDTTDLQAFIKKITSFMEAGGQVTDIMIDEFYQSLEANIASKFKARGFQQHRIERVGGPGVAITGYQTDNVHEVFLGYIRNMVGSIRKMNFAFDANNILRDIDIGKQGQLFSYVRQYRDDMLRNEHMADRVISNVRSVAYLYYLAANIKASAVNATQNIILGIPLYARALMEGGMLMPVAYAKAVKDLTKATFDVLRYRISGNLPADEYNMLQQAKVDGDSGAMQLQYMSGAMDRTMGGRYSNIVNFLGLPFSTIETLNREVAMLAFWRLHNGLPNSDRYRAARESMYDVHFPYGKYNYPEMVRSEGLLGNIGHLLSTFRSYSIMYVTTILNSFKGVNGRVSWRHADVFFGSIAILVLMGGLMAPWLDDLLDIYERMSGRPIRETIRKKLRDVGGEQLQAAGMHGIMSILGIDITGSLKLGVPFIGSGGIEETLLGAYSGLESKAERGVEAFKIGDYLRSIEEFSPAFVSNVMKGMREYAEGGTTIEGKKITDPRGDQYRPTFPEAVGQALGFRVGRRAEISESQRTFMNVKFAMTRERNKIYARLRKADTVEERRELLQEVRDFNKRAREFKGGVSFITMQSIKRAIIDKTDKRRRMFDMLFHEEE